MSRDDTIKDFKRMDRVRTVKKTAVITLFAVLLFVLVIYAIRIENKIDRLAREQAVVIYKTTVQDTTEQNDFINSFLQQEQVNYEETKAVESTTEKSSENIITSYDLDNRIYEDKATEYGNRTETAIASVETTNDSDETVEAEEPKFFVTETGKKYHMGHCSYLKKSKREVTISEIEKNGYEPCSKCIN